MPEQNENTSLREQGRKRCRFLDGGPSYLSRSAGTVGQELAPYCNDTTFRQVVSGLLWRQRASPYATLDKGYYPIFRGPSYHVCGGCQVLDHGQTTAGFVTESAATYPSPERQRRVAVVPCGLRGSPTGPTRRWRLGLGSESNPALVLGARIKGTGWSRPGSPTPPIPSWTHDGTTAIRTWPGGAGLLFSVFLEHHSVIGYSKPLWGPAAMCGSD